MTHGLNEEQSAAATALSGPVLISAGAGSGKTRTLCERFTLATRDIPEEGWRAAAVDEVLAITFTEKAAGEIAERVRAKLRQQGRRQDASRVDGAWISTIHGLCSRLLRRYALEAGLDPVFSVADPVELGRLKEQAFEAAARHAIENDGARTLFDALKFAEVYEAVTAAAASPAAQLGGVSSLCPVTPERTSAAVLADARTLFESAAGRVADCGSDSKTAAQVVQHCSRTLEALRAIEGHRLDEVALAEQVQSALVLYKPNRTTVKAIAEVRERIDARHRELSVEIVEIVGALRAGAIVGLAERYIEEFSAMKKAHGVLDFDDLQTETRRLLIERPDVRDRARGLFRLTMVDEFQDTDALQTGVIEQLAGEDLCTVGDERQAIYGFRGADVDVFRRHAAVMAGRGAREFELRTNYRSHRDVIGFVNALFGRQEFFGDKLIALEAGRTEPEPPMISGKEPRVEMAVGDMGECTRLKTLQLEADWVANRFASLRDDHGLRASDMVVLVRWYTHAEVYAAALRRVGLEAGVVGGNRLFGLAETAMVRALLRVIANPHDETALVELLAGDAGRLTDDGLWLLANAQSGGQPRRGLWEALTSTSEDLGAYDRDRAQVVVAAVESARARAGGSSLAELLLTALEELEVDLVLLSRGTDGRQAFANVLQLSRMIRSLEEQGVVGPAAVEAHLAAMQEYGVKAAPAAVSDEDSGVVRIMSVHAAKGLEFPVVAVVELDGYVKTGRSRPVRMGVLPGERSTTVAMKPHPDMAKIVGSQCAYARLAEQDRRAEEQEAKRLFYVACTRAREKLLLSGAVKLEKPPSEEDAQPMTTLRRATDDFGGCARDGRRHCGVRVGETEVTIELLEAPEEFGMGESDGPLSERPGEDRRRPQGGSSSPASAHPAPDVPPVVPTAPQRLSYSDISTYERCGLRFHAERVARVGGLNVFEPGGAAGFGSATHLVLQLAETGSLPPSERVDAIARRFSLDEQGRAELESTATAFLRSDLAADLFACDAVRREWPFVLRLHDGEHQFDLVGSLDAYGRSGNQALIIDYKTGGRLEDQGLEGRYRLQAGCYAVAASHDGCETIRVAFVRPQVCDASGQPQVIEFAFGREDVKRVEDELKVVHERMRSGRYSPLSHWDSEVCGECPIARTVCRVPAPPSRSRD